MNISKDPLTVRFLKHHRIPHYKGPDWIRIDNVSNLIHHIITNNELEIARKLSKDINEYMRRNYYIIEKIFGQCTLEMAFLFLDNSQYSFSTSTLRCVASRNDDNLEMFMACAEYFNFPNDYGGFIQYESGQISTIFLTANCAANNGNYCLFKHIVSENHLSSDHQESLKHFKETLWETNKFNPNILDLLVSDYGLIVTKDDIWGLIAVKNMQVIESIVDLVNNRKIIISMTEWTYLIKFAKNNYPDCVSLLESIQ
jgi:hypothetical protein